MVDFSEASGATEMNGWGQILPNYTRALAIIASLLCGCFACLLAIRVTLIRIEKAVERHFRANTRTRQEIQKETSEVSNETNQHSF